MNRRPGADQRLTRAAGQTSPPIMMTRISGRSAGGKAARIVGVKVATVIACSRKKVSSAGPGRKALEGTGQSVAPDRSALLLSDTEASKPGEKNWDTRSPGCTSKARIS